MKQRFIRIASSVAAVLLLAVGLIWLCHADPIEAFGYFCYGLFGSLNGFAEIFVKATPLILMGLGVSISEIKSTPFSATSKRIAEPVGARLDFT